MITGRRSTYRAREAVQIPRATSAIRALVGDIPDDGSRQAQQLTFIASNVLASRAAMMEHRPGDAVIAFQQAAEIQESQDFSSVSDPPAWYYPVRRDLAEALLARGDEGGARKEAAAALAYRVKDPGTLALLKKLGKD